MQQDTDVTLFASRSCAAPKVKSKFNHTWQQKTNLFRLSPALPTPRWEPPKGRRRGGCRWRRVALRLQLIAKTKHGPPQLAANERAASLHPTSLRHNSSGLGGLH